MRRIVVVFAAGALLAAVAFGAPLVSILFVGLLLLCPLLMWVPFRASRVTPPSAGRSSPDGHR